MVFRSIAVKYELYDLIKKDMIESKTNTLGKMLIKYREAYKVNRGNQGNNNRSVGILL